MRSRSGRRIRKLQVDNQRPMGRLPFLLSQVTDFAGFPHKLAPSNPLPGPFKLSLYTPRSASVFPIPSSPPPGSTQLFPSSIHPTPFPLYPSSSHHFASMGGSPSPDREFPTQPTSPFVTPDPPSLPFNSSLPIVPFASSSPPPLDTSYSRLHQRN